MARGMVELYLKQIFPLWYAADALARRDATAWVQQTIAATALNIVGILAGINRQYYVAFQFKRMRRFFRTMQIAPDNLADRLDGLFVADSASAIAGLEVWISPFFTCDLSTDELLVFLADTAVRAERLRRDGAAVVLLVGSELSLFNHGGSCRAKGSNTG